MYKCQEGAGLIGVVNQAEFLEEAVVGYGAGVKLKVGGQSERDKCRQTFR